MSESSTPPWGDEEFDANRAWTLISNLRTEKETLRSELAKTKSVADTATSQLKEAQAAAETARTEFNAFKRDTTRKSVLAELQIDEEDANEFLSGDLDDEAFRAKAERLATRLAGKTPAKTTEAVPDPEPQLPAKPKPAPINGDGSQDLSAEPDYASLVKYARGESGPQFASEN